MKFGRKPAVLTRRTSMLGASVARAFDKLGTPPPNSDDWTTAVERAVGGRDSWGMMGNGPDPGNPQTLPDGAGDCVQADDAHALMLRSANAGTIVIPTTADCLALYSAETGFNPHHPNTDNGTDETSDCSFMMSAGLLGHKAAATGPVDYTNINNLRWGVQLFGFTKLGIVVTEAMMDQFDNGDDWAHVPGSPIIGFHDVPMVRYYPNGSIDVISWGQRQHCAPSFVDPANMIIDEAHVLVYPDWVRACGTSPPGFNLSQLISDAQKIEDLEWPLGNHRQKRHRRQHRRHKHSN